MSGFTLVIIVMLIMFAAVAIVLTQDDDPDEREINDEWAAPKSNELGEVPAQEPLPVIEWGDESTSHTGEEHVTDETPVD